MMRRVITSFMAIFVLCAAPQSAQAQLCPSDNLVFDFIGDYAYGEVAKRPAQVHGTIDMPNPGYMYSMIFKPDLDEGVLHGVLNLHERNSGQAAASVITPMEINQGVEAPFDAIGVHIEVVKKFNWGPDFYKGQLKRGGYTACLEPGNTVKD